MKTRLLAAVVVAQIAVPLVATLDGVPSRFGFHMYSGREHLSVDVVDDSGRPITVDVAAAKLRPELNWSSVLPSAICAADARAHQVTVSTAKQTVTFTC